MFSDIKIFPDGQMLFVLNRSKHRFPNHVLSMSNTPNKERMLYVSLRTGNTYNMCLKDTRQSACWEPSATDCVRRSKRTFLCVYPAGKPSEYYFTIYILQGYTTLEVYE